MAFGLLIINRDAATVKIVTKLLKSCDYQTLHNGNLFDSVTALWNARHHIEPILFTNINRLGKSGKIGALIVDRMKLLFESEIIQITPNDSTMRFKGGPLSSTTSYVINVGDINTMNCLWSYASPTNPLEGQTNLQITCINEGNVKDDQLIKNSKKQTQKRRSSNKGKAAATATHVSSNEEEKRAKKSIEHDQGGNSLILMEGKTVSKVAEFHYCRRPFSIGHEEYSTTAVPNSSLQQEEDINAFLKMIDHWSGCLFYWLQLQDKLKPPN